MIDPNFEFFVGTEEEKRLWGVRNRRGRFEARVNLSSSTLVSRKSGKGSSRREVVEEFPTPGYNSVPVL